MQNRITGVGIIGSGSVVQGIHLPTLARVRDSLAVRHIMDVDLEAAQTVADRVGARASASVEELLTDPDVDVVAVCSPHMFHCEQVIAACRAGISVVLCEKPLATTSEQARLIAEAAAASGTRIVVGAMHSFDPAWTFAEQHGGDLRETATSIRSSIVLPFNDRYEGWATEVAAPVGIPQRDTSTPEARAVQITARVLGLGIHDIPLVRAFLPDWQDLTIASAELLAPLGYAITLQAGARTVQLVGSFRGHWLPEWEFEVTAPDASLHIDFAPSYVQAGSGTATITRGHRSVVLDGEPENGYEREWRHVAALAKDPSATSRDIADLVADLDFAVLVAERAGEHIRAAAAQAGVPR